MKHSFVKLLNIQFYRSFASNKASGIQDFLANKSDFLSQITKHAQSNKISDSVQQEMKLSIFHHFNVLQYLLV